MAKERFDAADLERFRKVQRLAYDAVTHVEAELHEGMTEKTAAARIEGWLRDRGVKRFFHHGFAWFGDRSAFGGFVRPPSGTLAGLLRPDLVHFGRQFQPTDRPLRRGDAVILDVAPVVDDVAADIGYSCTLGDAGGKGSGSGGSGGSGEAIHAARMALEPHRELILRLVRAGNTQRAIYRAVDELIEQQGYQNVHSYYPGAVLAHRIGKLPFVKLRLPRLGGFDLQALLYLGVHLARAGAQAARHKTPLWNADSDAPCEPGLWAVEPHLAKGAIGVKWEEILVVTEDTAYWLDDDLPHVRYWQQHAAASRRQRAPTTSAV